MGFLSALGNGLKKVGKVALKVAPIAAAPFTGGLSLIPSLAINAGLGAASSLASGGGMKGALLGAGMGAATGGLGGGAAKAGLSLPGGIPASAGGAALGGAGKVGGGFLSTLKGMAPDLLSAGGEIAGSVAQDRENRRDKEGAQQFQVDTARNAQTLNADVAGLDAEKMRMRQMLAADLLGTRGAGRINPETLAALKNRSTTAFNTRSDITRPTYAALPKAGKTDSFLNVLAGAGAGMNVLNDRRRVAAGRG